MGKSKLAKCIAERMSVSQELSSEFIKTLQDVLVEELNQGRKLMLQDFGAFLPWEQVARPGRNPQNGTPYVIRPRTSVKFKPGKGLLKRLNPEIGELGGLPDSATMD